MLLVRSCRHLFVAVFVILLTSCVLAQAPRSQATYDLKVSVEPKLGSISVRGTIDLPEEKTRANEMQFALHETFSIKQLTVNGHQVQFSEGADSPTLISPATKSIRFTLPADARGKPVRLSIEYGGELKKLGEFGEFADRPYGLDDQVNPRLVELASYSAWYPQFQDVGIPFAIQLEVSLPQGWVTICSGMKQSERVARGRVISRWSSPKDSDILVLASRDYKLKSKHFANTNVEIYYTQLPEPFIEVEAAQLARVTQLFTALLGEKSVPIDFVKHVYSPKRFGQGRAGFARTGMVVTSEGRMLNALKSDAGFSLFQDISHEIAHFWWNFGTGQGDWINEAFAEYFSAIAVEKELSRAQFESVLARYENAVRELPPDAPSLSKATFDGHGFVVRYYKGSLMVDQLRRALGDDAFFRAAREFHETYRGKPTGTPEFKAFWKLKLGDKAGLVDQWVDSEGALPKVAEQQKVVRESK